MTLALAVLPLLLLIATGYGLAKSQVLPLADWKGIETLSFRVLIPAVLILAIMDSDLSWAAFGPFMLVLLLTLCGLMAACLALRLLPLSRLGNPAFTSIFQTGIRWNAFVALAAAEQFIGTSGFAILAVAIALLIPLINITCIVVLSGFGPQQTNLRGVLRTVALNPLVQACAVGLTLYVTGLTLPTPLVETMEMLGRGALAIGLLAVGAGISLRRLARWDWKVAAALSARPLAGPILFVSLAGLAGLSAVQTFAGVLVFLAPASSSGYIVARQMGGDAGLYADVLTWQTVVSLVALPIWAWLLIG